MHLLELKRSYRQNNIQKYLTQNTVRRSDDYYLSLQYIPIPVRTGTSTVTDVLVLD